MQIYLQKIVTTFSGISPTPPPISPRGVARPDRGRGCRNAFFYFFENQLRFCLFLIWFVFASKSFIFSPLYSFFPVSFFFLPFLFYLFYLRIEQMEKGLKSREMSQRRERSQKAEDSLKSRERSQKQRFKKQRIMVSKQRKVSKS